MREYLVKRIVVALIVLWIIASLNFVIFQVISPVSPEKTIVDPDMTPEVRGSLAQLYGLNETLHVRYLKYISNMFTWNFGISFRSMQPVAEEMSWRLPSTVLLLGSALVGTILVGIPLGILAASRRGSKLDVTVIGGGLLTWGVPTFFIQLLFMLVLCYYTYLWFGFQVFPARGMYSIPAPTDPLAYMADVAWHLALPLLSLVVAGFGSWALYTRSMLLDALTQDYVVTARAKGLSERTVLYRHAFRSTLPPIVTMIALAIPGIVGGAMITEWIFTLPGIGRWYLTAMLGADYPVVQAVLFIYAVLTIFANLLSDLIYGILDPRIRVGARR
jgi:peptide/nickel transport system permease protein